MSNFTVDDYNKGIGAIIMNLQALESAIRFFFHKNAAAHLPEVLDSRFRGNERTYRTACRIAK